MGALGYNIAPVEDTLVAAGLLSLLCRHNVGEKVQCLNVAVEEAGILGWQ